MTTQQEREFGDKILDKWLAEVEAAIHHYERTLEGLQQRLMAELERREWLLTKRAELEIDECQDHRSTANWISKVLLEHGKPMRVSEIVRTLESNDIPCTSENGLMNTVMSALSRRSDKFRRVDRGVYALADDDSSKVRAHGTRQTRRKLELVSS